MISNVFGVVDKVSEDKDCVNVNNKKEEEKCDAATETCDEVADKLGCEDKLSKSCDSEANEQKGCQKSEIKNDQNTLKRTNFVEEEQIDFDKILKKKWWSRFCKRAFDLFASFVGIIILLPLFVLISLLIATTSQGGVFFKQIRVGKKGKNFKILKFRTMTKNAESKGMQITVGQDMRITKIGKILRATKIDELPQLINVLFGKMSLVGARPEVPKYVEMYSEYEKNILKIRPGITELSSIIYKDEANVLAEAENPEDTYINEIMPKKLQYNLEYVQKLGLFYDIKLIFKTLLAIIK